jgi:hypothetical protein
LKFSFHIYLFTSFYPRFPLTKANESSISVNWQICEGDWECLPIPVVIEPTLVEMTMESLTSLGFGSDLWLGEKLLILNDKIHLNQFYKTVLLLFIHDVLSCIFM